MRENVSDSSQPSTPAAPGAWRSALTAISVTAMLVLVSAAACADQETPRETVGSLRAKSPTLRDKTILYIGVRDDLPYVSYKDDSGIRTGFEIEIARELAEDLGFREDKIEWVSVGNLPKRLSVIQEGKADIVLANISISEDREKLVDFAGPYQLVPQAVLARRDRKKKLDTIADLRKPDVRICTTTGSTSEKALKDKGIPSEPVDANSHCMDGMRAGTYDAFSTDLPILAGMLKADKETTGKDSFEILDLAIADSNEQIGVAVPEGDHALRDLIAYFLEKWRQQPQSSPWLRAYDNTIGAVLDREYRSQPRVTNPPKLADFDSKAPQR